MSDKKSFVMYYDWREIFAELTDEEAGKLIKMIYDYECDRVAGDMNKLLKLAFLPIKSALDNDRAKYEDVCEKRKEAGKKGGRPHKIEVLADCEEENQMVSGKSKKTKRFLEKAKKPDNDNVNDSVNDNDNDNVNVCVVNDDEDNTNTYDEKNKLYGRFVKLTEEQHQLLLAEYGSDILGEYIDRVDSYIEGSGKKPYKNHYRTLKNWLTKDDVKKLSEQPIQMHSYNLDEILKSSLNVR